MPASVAIESRIHDRAPELAEFHDGICGFEVTLGSQPRRDCAGRVCSVRVVLIIPGSQIVISRNTPSDLSFEEISAAIDSAIAAAGVLLSERSHAHRSAMFAAVA